MNKKEIEDRKTSIAQMNRNLQQQILSMKNDIEINEARIQRNLGSLEILNEIEKSLTKESNK